MKQTQSVQVTACNINYPHAPEYLLDLPDGDPDRYVFIHFLTSFELYTQDGFVSGGVDDCVLYAPGFRQWNRGVEVPLVNNWLHISGADAAALIDGTQIPCNQLFHIEDAGFIEPAIGSMRRELYERRTGFNRMLSLYAQTFLIELQRRLHEEDTLHLSTAEAVHLVAFRNLRHQLLREFARSWSVTEMAESVHLSRSRFTVLYTRIFGVPPLEDLLQMRLEHACALLADSEMTIERIADLCGFGSAIHFHRIFRKRMGCTPREYASLRIASSGGGRARVFDHHC